MCRKILLLLMVTILVSCQESDKETAQSIVDKAIEKACSGSCDSLRISFQFRGKAYQSERQGGVYRLERRFSDSLGSIHDVLSNTGFQRTINDSVIKLSDSLQQMYGNSVNSVHYFVQLPFGLNDPAVNKRLLGQDTVAGEPYYEVQVTFREEGGGTDFEDEFVYWIHQEAYTVDYLAYSYATDGGGVRFRQAFRPRVVNGVRFVDYRNFKPESTDVVLQDLDEAFEADKLKLLSTIVNDSIEVTRITP